MKRLLVVLFVLFFAQTALFAQALRPLQEREILYAYQKIPYNRLQIKVLRYQGLDKKFLDRSLSSCLGLELELVQDPKEPWNFFVRNQNTQESLSQVLTKIKDWSNAHPGHFLLTIYLKINENSVLGDDRVFSRRLDRLLKEKLSVQHLFVPAYLQRDAKTLLEGARRYGWPKLSELRSCFLIVLTGDDSKRLLARRKMIYTYSEPYKRVAFVDIDQRAASKISREHEDISNPYYQEGSRVFIKLRPEKKAWQSLAKQAHQRGFICHLKAAKGQLSTQNLQGSMVNSIVVEDILKNPLALMQEIPSSD